MNDLPMYATVEDVAAGFREIEASEQPKCYALIEEAGVIVDAIAINADESRKRIVVCRMVRRALGSGEVATAPMGSTQGSVSALGYSQSWTLGGGASTGELYIGKTERQLLGLGNKIGASNPYKIGGGCCD